MDRAPGLSIRLKLTLSYAGFLMVAGAVLLAAVWVFLLRDVPDVTAAPGGLLTRNGLARNFAPAAGAVLAFLLVLGLVGGWILAGRMLAPLSRITDATRMAANGSLSHRIHLEGRDDEFRELADSFDAMLAQLEAQVAEQQRFAANASHELRTPLAVTQTLLDVARNDPDRDNGELIDRLQAVNTRAIDLTEALLLLSRADQRSFARDHVDLSLVAEEATETLLPLAEERGVTIETSGDVTPTIGSHALLLQMSTNLVHNAIVHNLPEQGTVWVTTSVQPKSVVLTVENTGKVLGGQLVSTLAEPFQRGSKRVRTDHAGVGLGLAIVKSITQAHEGALALTPRAAGGLCVTVQLPAAPPHTGDDDQGNSRTAGGQENAPTTADLRRRDTERAVSQENVEFVKGLYAGAAQMDKDQLLAALPGLIEQVCHPEIEWVEDPRRADARTYRGHRGVLESWTRWLENFDEYGGELEEVLDCGDRVLAVAREEASGTESGAPVTARLYQVITFRDAKIVRYEEFYAEADALKAAGLSE